MEFDGFSLDTGVFGRSPFFPRGRVVAIVAVAKMIVAGLGGGNDWGCFAVFLQMRELDSLSWKDVGYHQPMGLQIEWVQLVIGS